MIMKLIRHNGDDDGKANEVPTIITKMIHHDGDDDRKVNEVPTMITKMIINHIPMIEKRCFTLELKDKIKIHISIINE